MNEDKKRCPYCGTFITSPLARLCDGCARTVWILRWADAIFRDLGMMEAAG